MFSQAQKLVLFRHNVGEVAMTGLVRMLSNNALA